MAANITISDRFATQCAVVVNNSYDTHGTITRASIDYLTPSELESVFAPDGLFADLDAWFRSAIEMKACGTRTYGFYDWIMSGADRMGKKLLNVQKVSKGPSLLMPFILGNQNSVLNTDFWAVTNGWNNGSGTGTTYTPSVTGPLTNDSVTGTGAGVAGDRIVRVVSRYGIELTNQWFVDRDIVHIFTATGGVSEDGQWKVLASAAASDNSYVDVLITSQNGGSDASFKAAPTTGLLLAGTNNVNDFEKFCQNRPTLDGRKKVPFWFKTMRRGRQVDSLYKEYYARMMTSGVNEAFKAFGDLDLAERNRQDELQYQKRFCVDFLFNRAADANQTLALWESLPTISTPSGYSIDPGTGGKTIAKRAEFIGVKDQLRACGAYTDMTNQPLNWYEWLDLNYRIKRSRESQGKTVTDIDWYTDERFATRMMTAYIGYIKLEYGDAYRMTASVTEASNELGFVWKTFHVLFPSGVRINIITHPLFNDLRDAAVRESIESRGTMLLCLEWGAQGIRWGQIASNKKVHTVGELEKLAALDKDWACVMESVTQEVTMISETGTVLIDCPNHSHWIENLRDAVPILTGGSGTYVDLV